MWTVRETEKKGRIEQESFKKNREPINDKKVEFLILKVIADV